MNTTGYSTTFEWTVQGVHAEDVPDLRRKASEIAGPLLKMTVQGFFKDRDGETVFLNRNWYTVDLIGWENAPVRTIPVFFDNRSIAEPLQPDSFIGIHFWI